MSPLLLFLSLLLLAPSDPVTGGGRAGTTIEPETVRNRSFQVKYAVPAQWPVVHQRTDSLEVLRYYSPDGGQRLYVGQLRGSQARIGPAQALQRMLRHLGTTHHQPYHAPSQGLDFLESTGTCRISGRALRYDARVTSNQGQVLLVYLYATTSHSGPAPVLHHFLDSLTPLRTK